MITTTQPKPATTLPTQRPRDHYDHAVDYLTQRPVEIPVAWGEPIDHVAGCLFQFVSPSGGPVIDKCCFGCLTQIRKGLAQAYTPELTDLIRNDERIPSSGYEIKPAHLPLFADYQRLIDQELGRKV